MKEARREQSACALEAQGLMRGACDTSKERGKFAPACQLTLRRREDQFERLIHAIHLSRPEHYLSVYQSGCNHSCKKCHSAQFSKRASGSWVSTDQLAETAEKYAQKVTVKEPRERATMWHATDLCRGCGLCLTEGRRHPLCPEVLMPEQIVLSPQGFGPARNIVAFTGGDIACRAEFYAEAARKIKGRAPQLWVLLETNGYGLTPQNLDLLKEAGVDSFWLDIKAFDAQKYQWLCGTDNETVLKAPERILERGFVLEVLSLYIPSVVEEDDIGRTAGLVASLDPEVPFTILAFFPAYVMSSFRPPSLEEMLRAYEAAEKAGLRKVKLGNAGVFLKSRSDWEGALLAVGPRAIG